MLTRAALALAILFFTVQTPAHAEGLFDLFGGGKKTEAAPNEATPSVATPVAPTKPTAPEVPKVETPKVESQPAASFNATSEALKTEIKDGVKSGENKPAAKPAEKTADKKDEKKAEPAKAEVKTEEKKADEKKTEEVKKEETKATEKQGDEKKTEEPKKTESINQVEGAKKEEPKAEEKKAEEIKKPEETKKEDAKPATTVVTPKDEDPSGLDVSKTLYGLAKKNGANTYAELMSYAKIDMRLKLPGNMTLFAPSDSAFEKLGGKEIESLKKPENLDKLNALLTYHIVNGKMDEKRLKGQMNAPNASQGDVLMIDGTGSSIKVGTGEITRGDIEATNGVLHIIDAVQIPPKH